MLLSIIQTDMEHLAHGRRGGRAGQEINGKPVGGPARDRKEGRVVLAFQHRREREWSLDALRSSLGEHLDAGVFHQREMTDLAVRDRKVMVEAHAQDQPLQPIGLLQVLVHLGLERGEGQTLTGKVQEEIGESGQGVFVPVSVRLDKPIKIKIGVAADQPIDTLDPHDFLVWFDRGGQ